MRELNADIQRYIERGDGSSPAASSLNAEARAWLARVQGGTEASALGEEGELSATQRSFVDSIAPLARDAAQRLGVAPEIVVAQAALETGWGTRPIRRADGSDSNNLFSIKAGSSWRGDSTEIMTTEFDGTGMVSQRDSFRAYTDPAAAFEDFTRLISSSPRYREALNAGGDVRAYAQALQRGGYATDPDYVGKLARITAQIQGD
ncbi:MAG: flagellar assembly peptidoglycan hydrolase FlgJ [Candidatus Dactylopiibacterium carminicum]|uniref:Flagellar assembly peptidoglycan hydrolase FlgJ n=2 Tax=Candidatus Dactylopiibacterium carminicum TaxID=857335 RepID=A0A272EWL7_9RHOO|nr:flagellar assembly peptidoglycan hydrolase FlgJ [Candidatus Dactylopiibacterium carminicum]PAS94504.1 MAG: flagellar assembly peptidoglycan hydrolase FlgJ [Candidatus Dactylopiibacterium carminicum]PAS97070.1 MAG: flagellar assembly peptidoglycan hydrolase FlgJ [Candidatus Dactylopiibacterium carminicum]